MDRYSGLEFDPVDYYNKILKNEVNDKITKQVEDLTKISNIDINKNKSTAKKVYELKNKIDKEYSSLKRNKIFRTILIILSVISVISILFGILNIFNKGSELVSGLTIGIGAFVFIVSLLVIFLVLNKNIKNLQSNIEKINKEYSKKYAEALEELSPLKNLFNFKQFVDLVNNSNSVISLDYEVSQKKLLMLKELFDYNSEFNISQSIVDVYSGNIEKNPFLRVLLNNERMKDVTYTGTRVVTWVETYTDSEGHTRTRTESQTLVAYYKAPAPFYSTSSLVIYGNEAAPDLCFSRYPSGLDAKDDEDDVEKLVKKNMKKIEKKEYKSIKSAGSFQSLANDDFEALFNATDRNHEVQYRLLFTPLAQQNMIELITKKEPYIDDFSFVKNKKMNYVFSRHSSNNIRFDYLNYTSYFDYKVLKEDYIKNMNEAFASLYFDVAPILAIPLYQLHEAGVFNPSLEKEEITLYEAEAFINHMDRNLFKHPQTTTDQILKLNKIKSLNNSDLFKVTSYSYVAIPQVEIVPVLCNNGRYYNVDVKWYRYDRLVKDSNVAISKIKEDSKVNNTNDNVFKYRTYRYHNFVSCFLDQDDFTEESDNLFVSSIKNHYNFIK